MRRDEHERGGVFVRLRRRRPAPRRAAGSSQTQRGDVRPPFVAAETIRDRRPGHGHREQGRPPVRAVLLARQSPIPELHRPEVPIHQHARVRQARRHRRARGAPVWRGLRRPLGRPGQGRRHRDPSQDDEDGESADAGVTGLAGDAVGGGPVVVRRVLVHASGIRRGRREGAGRSRARRKGPFRGRGVLAGGGAVRPRRHAHRSTRGGDGGDANGRHADDGAPSRRRRGPVARAPEL
mmetsp:Transcript_6125/g.25398  ORF Transcript_6125/g.25398 Transcript_6125/m.25398 type:complete len:237 (-) Transcript_6125:1111-1821(-)